MRGRGIVINCIVTPVLISRGRREFRRIIPLVLGNQTVYRLSLALWFDFDSLFDATLAQMRRGQYGSDLHRVAGVGERASSSGLRRLVLMSCGIPRRRTGLRSLHARNRRGWDWRSLDRTIQLGGWQRRGCDGGLLDSLLGGSCRCSIHLGLLGLLG